MRKLNAKISFFVTVQIMFGIFWIFVSNNLHILFENIGPLVHDSLYAIGLRGLALSIIGFVLIVGTMLGTLIGLLLWISAGTYRRGIGMVAFVMGVGLLFGAAAYHMRPLNEIEGVGWAYIARAVFALVAYFGIAAATASQVLEWIAQDDLNDRSVTVRWTHSVPLCTILPAAHLFIGYAQTMRAQFAILAIASLILVVFTWWTNRSRATQWTALESANRHPRTASPQGQARIGSSTTPRRLR